MSTNQNIKATSIPGLFVVDRSTFSDERGFFREVFHLDELVAASGINFTPIQWNHSRSLPGVIRGLHIEPWNKLVYPVSGEMFAAIADVRPDSETFGKVEAFTFDDSHKYALFLAEGLANSVCVTGDVPVDYVYLVDAYYGGKPTKAIAWDDPDLVIDWPIKNPIISKRDQENIKLRDLYPGKFKP